MKHPFATNNKLGAGLTAPSTQSILPVLCGGNGQLLGFYPIASTTFDGTETSFTLSQGDIKITSVKLPPRVNDGSGYGVVEYMAAYFDGPTDLRTEPWLGYQEFISNNDLGYRMQWYQPTVGSGYVLTRGIFLSALEVSMDQTPYVPDVPVPPTGGNATIYWKAKLGLNAAQYECAFFDFNWVVLFNAKTEGRHNPMRIEFISNPPGGEFKSTLVAFPSATVDGDIEFNTVRVVRLKDAAPGDYPFVYKVTDRNNLSILCNLTLTIV